MHKELVIACILTAKKSGLEMVMVVPACYRLKMRMKQAAAAAPVDDF